MGLGFGKCDVYTFPWSRNAWETQSIIPSLVSKLEEKFKKESIDKKKKFIIASHSWGTQLATLALQYKGLFTSFEVKPDLLLTLSDPEGSNLVDPAEYTNTRFCPSCGVSISYPVFSPSPPFYKWVTVTPELTVDMAEGLVNGFVSYEHALTETALFLNPLYLHHDLRYKKWINYWDVGDLISGPLDTDNKTVRNDTERDFQNMKEVHAITSLCCEDKRDSNWRSYNVIDEGKSFRDTVCDDIADVIGGTCDHGLICAGPEGPFCPWPTAQPPCGPTPNTCGSLRTVDGGCFCHEFVSCTTNADCNPGWRCSNSCCGSNLCHPPCGVVGGVVTATTIETKPVPMSCGNSEY
jgi:hypothetical protein